MTSRTAAPIQLPRSAVSRLVEVATGAFCRAEVMLRLPVRGGSAGRFAPVPLAVGEGRVGEGADEGDRLGSPCVVVGGAGCSGQSRRGRGRGCGTGWRRGGLAPGRPPA